MQNLGHVRPLWALVIMMMVVMTTATVLLLLLFSFGRRRARMTLRMLSLGQRPAIG